MTSRKAKKPAPSKTATAVSARHTPLQAIYDPAKAIREVSVPGRISGTEGSHQRVTPYIQNFLNHVNINYSLLDPERAKEFRAFSGALTITHRHDDAPGLLEYTTNASFKGTQDLIHSYVGTYQSVTVNLGKVDKNGCAPVYRNGRETSRVYNVDDFAGSEVADRFKGDDDANVFYGGGGNDKIWGRGGNDQLSGGVGDDIIRGGSGHDLIWGNQGNDTLYGGRGNDWLHGGRGADDLYGGKGADTFAYTHVSESTGKNKDTIHDFSIKDGDVLDFSKLIDTFKRPEDVKIWLTDLADNAGTTVHVGYGPKSKHVLSLDLMGVKAEDLQHSAESFKLGQHEMEVEYGPPSVDDGVTPVVDDSPQALALQSTPDVTKNTPREVTHPVSGTKSDLTAVDGQVDRFTFASQGQYTIDGFNLGDGDTLDFSKFTHTFESWRDGGEPYP